MVMRRRRVGRGGDRTHQDTFGTHTRLRLTWSWVVQKPQGLVQRAQSCPTAAASRDLQGAGWRQSHRSHLLVCDERLAKLLMAWPAGDDTNGSLKTPNIEWIRRVHGSSSFVGLKTHTKEAALLFHSTWVHLASDAPNKCHRESKHMVTD